MDQYRLRSRRENLDRFIPNRSAIDFGYARCMLTERWKFEDDALKSDYQKVLEETFNMNSSRRILAFKDKPLCTTVVDDDFFPKGFLSFYSEAMPKPSNPRRRFIPHVPDKTLDAPFLLCDDYSFNLLHWGSGNMLCIALGSMVYLWNASTGSTSELFTVDEVEIGPVTSVRWSPDCRHLAVGFYNSGVQLWDPSSETLLRTFNCARVGSIDWHSNHVLTTGGKGGKIINSDVRVGEGSHEVYRGHRGPICGLTWSGNQFASGGSDKLLHVWDRRLAGRRWLHRLQDHSAAVRALSWCPFQANLLASGGGEGDHCIKFWNTYTGASLNSVNTGSQVCALLWNKKERELLSSHGLPHNQLRLWRYPSMRELGQVNTHFSPVLFMANSPDGCTVASAAG